MIRESIEDGKSKITVILHSYTLKRNQTQWDYSEDINPNPNDGNRHHIRSFIIAIDDKPYPSEAKLKTMLQQQTKSHSNIKTSQQYGEKLGGFCPQCLAVVRQECNKKWPTGQY